MAAFPTTMWNDEWGKEQYKNEGAPQWPLSQISIINKERMNGGEEIK